MIPLSPFNRREKSGRAVVTAHANPWHCQAALAVTQAAFCCGSVYLKSSLQQAERSSGVVFHPIIYAFLREAIAAPIMIAIAWFTSGTTLMSAALQALPMLFHVISCARKGHACPGMS